MELELLKSAINHISQLLQTQVTKIQDLIHLQIQIPMLPQSETLLDITFLQKLQLLLGKSHLNQYRQKCLIESMPKEISIVQQKPKKEEQRIQSSLVVYLIQLLNLIQKNTKCLPKFLIQQKRFQLFQPLIVQIQKCIIIMILQIYKPMKFQQKQRMPRDLEKIPLSQIY
ncbi:unnamed protein product [Paramecium octaurelia]|uniref:Uncharacterized protein n=1 Tax=Paramecium octaurelia TaxID=43137 RepID=A0A8S1XGP6_PAROT|nr:unnamed protein product [Paramecium octaurelia]